MVGLSLIIFFKEHYEHYTHYILYNEAPTVADVYNQAPSNEVCIYKHAVFAISQFVKCHPC